MFVVRATRFQGNGKIPQSVEWERFLGLSAPRITFKFALGCLTPRSKFLMGLCTIFFVLCSAASLHSLGPKIATRDYGLGYSIEIQSPESEVLKAVENVVSDGIIQGSKEFNKDKYIESANAASSSPLFPEWKEPGTVYYKVREGVLAPLNFKDSKDQGTVAVRYIVQAKDASRTILRIDAVFVEDFHRTVHQSNGSVENAESQDVQDHIDAVKAEKRQTDERERQHQQKLAGAALERKRQADEAAAFASGQPSAQTLDQHLNSLRHQAERVVKAPGSQLKSAPFSSASKVKSLAAGEEVVILVVTQYWYGVETTDGQHGWINRSQLESLP